MNLRAVANTATRAINANIAVTLKSSTGFAVDSAGNPVPSYAADETIIVQVQALTQSELQHLNSIDISNGQGSMYADRQLTSVDRPTQSGGDIIVFGNGADTPAGLRGQTWLVVATLEGWPGGNWCKVAITSQMP
jgi:hypothetical protein